MIISKLRALFIGLMSAGILACGAGASAQAQGFPSRTVTLVIPYAAGGLSDIIARHVAKELQESLGQPVIVDNKVGGSGIVATRAVLNAPHDGHTLLVADMQQWAITPATFATLPYDPEKDLTGVAVLATTEMFLIAGTSHKFKDIKDVIARVKANPGKYNYGSSGVASFQHLTIEAFRAGAGLDLVHVPYRGGPPVMQAIVADEIAFALQSWGQSEQLIKDGKIQLVAVAAPARAAIAPDIPTFTESGVPGVDFPPSMGIVAPAGVPKPIIDRLAAEFKKAMARPAIQEAFKKYNMTPVGAGPAETDAWMKKDREKLAVAVKAAGLKPQ